MFHFPAAYAPRLPFPFRPLFAKSTGVVQGNRLGRVRQSVSLGILLLAVLFSQSDAKGRTVELVVAYDELQLVQREGRWLHRGERFSGLAERRDAEGRLLERTSFRQGKRHGKAMRYFPSGQVQKSLNYQMNRIHGVTRIWSPYGNLRARLHHVAGVAQGVQRHWHENGQLSKERNMLDGREHGLQRAWLANGKIYVNYEYKNGRRYGLKRSTLCFELEDENVQL